MNPQNEATLAGESAIQSLSLVLRLALLPDLPETSETIRADV